MSSAGSVNRFMHDDSFFALSYRRHSAGGISAILKELARVPGLLHADCPTVTGKTLGENISAAVIRDAGSIRPLRPLIATNAGWRSSTGTLLRRGRL